MSLLAVNNFLHLIFAVVWIGGMIFMNLVLMPSLTTLDVNERGKLFGAVAKRFTIVSWTSVLLLLISGLIKTPEGLLFNTSSDYGIMLVFKHIIFVLMIISGFLITFIFAPKIRNLTPKPGERPNAEFSAAQNKIKLLSSINMVLGIIVLFLISIY